MACASHPIASRSGICLICNPTGRHDSWQNLTTGIGVAGQDKTRGTTFEADVVTDGEAREMYRGDDIAARIVETWPKEMLRRGFSLAIAPDQETSDTTQHAPPPGDDEDPDGEPVTPSPTGERADLFGKPPAKPGDDEPAPDEVPDPNAPTDESKIPDPTKPVPKPSAKFGAKPGDPADPAAPVGVKPIKAPDEQGRIKKITKRWKDLGVAAKFQQAMNYSRAYGGSAVMIGANDGSKDLAEPLNEKAVKKIEWLTVLEARECIPVYWYTNPMAEKYGQPMIYQLNALPPGASAPKDPVPVTQQMVLVHESRLIIFDGVRVSRLVDTQGVYGWGDSVFTRVKNVLSEFNISWAAASSLLHDFSQAVFKIKGLAEIVAQDSNKQFIARLRGLQQGRSIANAVLIDTEEEFERKATPVAGMPDLLDRFMMRLAAAADMPLTLLFGMSPGGLNATGESDIRLFYDRVDAKRTEILLPAIERITRMLFNEDGQGEPEDWSINFPPLYQPSEKEQADTRYVQAQTDALMITNSVLSAEEVALARYGGDVWSAETHIDFAARAQLATAAPKPVDKPGEDPNAKPPPIMIGPDGKPLPPGMGPDGKPLPPSDGKPGKGFPFGKKAPAPGGGKAPPFPIGKPAAKADGNEDQPRAANGQWGEGSGDKSPEAAALEDHMGQALAHIAEGNEHDRLAREAFTRGDHKAGSQHAQRAIKAVKAAKRALRNANLSFATMRGTL